MKKNILALFFLLTIFSCCISNAQYNSTSLDLFQKQVNDVNASEYFIDIDMRSADSIFVHETWKFSFKNIASTTAGIYIPENATIMRFYKHDMVKNATLEAITYNRSKNTILFRALNETSAYNILYLTNSSVFNKKLILSEYPPQHIKSLILNIQSNYDIEVVDENGNNISPSNVSKKYDVITMNFSEPSFTEIHVKNKYSSTNNLYLSFIFLVLGFLAFGVGLYLRNKNKKKTKFIAQNEAQIKYDAIEKVIKILKQDLIANNIDEDTYNRLIDKYQKEATMLKQQMNK